MDLMHGNIYDVSQYIKDTDHRNLQNEHTFLFLPVFQVETTMARFLTITHVNHITAHHEPSKKFNIDN